ncbi:MAG TPA: SPOR domain-containing protein [Spirochaetota bacterium]|nr:SPOR domain-containing protein [Spirochaetota bacterium]
MRIRLLPVLLLFILASIPVFPAVRTIDDARKAIASGDEPGARAILQTILRSGGDSPGRAGVLALLISLEHLVGPRIALLEEYVRRYPREKDWRGMVKELAWLNLASGKYADAALLLTRLVAVPEERESALLGLVRIAIAQENWDQAERSCTALEREYPDGVFRPTVLACQARIHLARGRNKEASLAWHAIIEKFGRSDEAPGAWLALGEMAATAKDIRLAQDYLTKLVRAFPASMEAGLARSRLRLLAVENPRTSNLRVWEVQLAVYHAKSQAEAFVAKLRAAGYLSFVQQETVGGRIQYSVRMGYFRTREDAAQVLAGMQHKGYEGFIRTRTVTVTEDVLGRE